MSGQDTDAAPAICPSHTDFQRSIECYRLPVPADNVLIPARFHGAAMAPDTPERLRRRAMTAHRLRAAEPAVPDLRPENVEGPP